LASLGAKGHYIDDLAFHFILGGVLCFTGKDMDFEVIIDEQFMDMCLDDQLDPIENKNVLSIVNDFQDGKWRYSKFRKFIWDNIAETALSFDERKSLVDESYSSLVESAKSLRLTDAASKIGQGSELAEIVLYGIMKHHFGALPAVPKIFYKQNAQDNAKGNLIRPPIIKSKKRTTPQKI
jgi:hypothetical protein